MQAIKDKVKSILGDLQAIKADNNQAHIRQSTIYMTETLKEIGLYEKFEAARIAKEADIKAQESKT